MPELCWAAQDAMQLDQELATAALDRTGSAGHGLPEPAAQPAVSSLQVDYPAALPSTVHCRVVRRGKKGSRPGQKWDRSHGDYRDAGGSHS